MFKGTFQGTIKSIKFESAGKKIAASMQVQFAFDYELASAIGEKMTRLHGDLECGCIKSALIPVMESGLIIRMEGDDLEIELSPCGIKEAIVKSTDDDCLITMSVIIAFNESTIKAIGAMAQPVFVMIDRQQEDLPGV